VSKYLTKGSLAMIEGRLKLDQWEDKTSGQKRSKIKVVLDNVQFLSTRGGAGGGGGGASAGASDGIDQTSPERHAPPARGNTKAAPQENLDEDVPF
jgi:single-strand DNA-binding protein